MNGDSYQTGFVAASQPVAEDTNGLQRAHRNIKRLWGAVGLLALAVLGLLVGVIVLGARDDDGSPAQAKQAFGSEAGLAPVVLSSSQQAPEGYAARGVLGAGGGTWMTKALFPANSAGTGMSDGSAAAIGGTIYYVGGYSGGAVGHLPSNRTYVYDAFVDAFSEGPQLPVPVARGAAASDGVATVYYTAGITRAQGAPEAPVNTTCLFSLDTSSAAARWQTHPCMTQPRSDHCAAWVGGKLYVAGGYDAAYTMLDSIEEFDPATNAWTMLDLKLPTGRGDVSCAVLGGKIYVVGGIDGTFDDPVSELFTDAVTAIDVAAGTVTPKAPLLHKRGDLALAAASDETLVAIGGESHDSNASRTLIATHVVSVYHAAKDLWVPKAPLDLARFRASAASIKWHDGTVTAFVLGGHHRCDAPPDYANPDDDGQCDEIGPVQAFVDDPTPVLFLFSQSP